MSLEALKQELAALDEKSRSDIFHFLASMHEERWAAEARRLARNLDDPDPDRWLTMEEFSRRLDLIPPPPDE
jgi:hypothetical protein